MIKLHNHLKRSAGSSFRAVLTAVGVMALASAASADNMKLNREFNERGNILIADQFNNRVIESDTAGNIIWSFGLGPNDFSAKSIIGVNDARRVGDQFNNRVIRVSLAGQIVASYGLPLAGGDPIGNNVGYDIHTTQNGLYSPYDAKVVGDYTGLTPPEGFKSDR